MLCSDLVSVVVRRGVVGVSDAKGLFRMDESVLDSSLTMILRGVPWGLCVLQLGGFDPSLSNVYAAEFNPIHDQSACHMSPSCDPNQVAVTWWSYFVVCFDNLRSRPELQGFHGRTPSIASQHIGDPVCNSQ